MKIHNLFNFYNSIIEEKISWMALDLLNDATNTLAATSLGQQVIESFNQGVDQMLLDNGIDTLNVQDLQRIIV